MSRDPSLCKDCGSAPIPGSRRCESCKLAHAARERERRVTRRAQGLCVVCGDWAVVDAAGVAMSLCDEHRLAYERRRSAVRSGSAQPTTTRAGLFRRVATVAQETARKRAKAKPKPKAARTRAARR